MKDLIISRDHIVPFTDIAKDTKKIVMRLPDFIDLKSDAAVNIPRILEEAAFKLGGNDEIIKFTCDDLLERIDHFVQEEDDIHLLGFYMWAKAKDISLDYKLDDVFVFAGELPPINEIKKIVENSETKLDSEKIKKLLSGDAHFAIPTREYLALKRRTPDSDDLIKEAIDDSYSDFLGEEKFTLDIDEVMVVGRTLNEISPLLCGHYETFFQVYLALRTDSEVLDFQETIDGLSELYKKTDFRLDKEGLIKVAKTFNSIVTRSHKRSEPLAFLITLGTPEAYLAAIKLTMRWESQSELSINETLRVVMIERAKLTDNQEVLSLLVD